MYKIWNKSYKLVIFTTNNATLTWCWKHQNLINLFPRKLQNELRLDRRYKISRSQSQLPCDCNNPTEDTEIRWESEVASGQLKVSEFNQFPSPVFPRIESPRKHRNSPGESKVQTPLKTPKQLNLINLFARGCAFLESLKRIASPRGNEGKSARAKNIVLAEQKSN